MSIPDRFQITRGPPDACKGYKRRVSTLASNGGSVGPNSTINITPDASITGTFMDPQTAYVMFDLKISNNFSTVDYTNWGPEGVGGAVFSALSISNQGSPTEDIQNYGVVAAGFERFNGNSGGHTYLYMKNRVKGRDTTGGYGNNLIKPPMCDEQGCPMFCTNPWGLGFEASNNNTIYANSTVAASGGVPTRISCTPVYGGAYSRDTIYEVNTLNGSLNKCYIDTNDATAGPTKVNSETLGTSWVSNARGPKVVTPIDWVDFYDPSMSIPMHFVQEFGSVNKVQMMANLTNVKCYPIGMRPGSDGYNTTNFGKVPVDIYDGTLQVTAPTATEALLAPVMQVMTYRVCYRLLSGILGVLNPKMLPSSLLSPTGMVLTLQTAPVHQALNISSDPCRVLPSTIRDRVRNLGQANGSNWGDQTMTVSTTINDNPYSWATTTLAPGYSPSYMVPVATAGNAIFSKEAVLGRCTKDGQIAHPIAIQSFTITTGVLVITSLGFRIPAGSVFTALIDSVNYSGVINGVTNATSYKAVLSPIPVANLATGSGNVLLLDALSACPATPEYVLMKEPWKYKRIRGASALVTKYASENEVFYGSRLPESVPQVKRILQFPYADGTNQTPITSSSGIAPFYGSGITYSLDNVQFVVDQYCLEANVTDALMDYAYAGLYTQVTSSFRSYVIPCAPNQTTQQLLLPMKVADAKRIITTFQNQNQIDAAKGIFHDSNCGYNIFAAVRKNATIGTQNMFVKGFNSTASIVEEATTPLYGVGYNNPMIYEPTSTGSTAFTAQLQIGGVFYPPQAIRSMAELAVETAKTMGGWGDSNWKANLEGKVISPYNTQASRNSDTAVVAQAHYDCLKADQFTTAYIDPDHLDDQTIGVSYDFAPLYSIFDHGAPPAVSTSNSTTNGYNALCPRGYCVNNVFTVPSSDFAIAWDLQTFHAADGVTDGLFLGTANMFLNLTGAVALAEGNWRCVAWVPHHARMTFGNQGKLDWRY